jgi:hypothetical protein
LSDSGGAMEWGGAPTCTLSPGSAARAPVAPRFPQSPSNYKKIKTLQATGTKFIFEVDGIDESDGRRRSMVMKVSGRDSEREEHEEHEERSGQASEAGRRTRKEGVSFGGRSGRASEAGERASERSGRAGKRAKRARRRHVLLRRKQARSASRLAQRAQRGHAFCGGSNSLTRRRHSSFCGGSRLAQRAQPRSVPLRRKWAVPLESCRGRPPPHPAAGSAARVLGRTLALRR